MTRRLSRRQFLQTGALAGVGFWAAGGVSLVGARDANSKLNIACIGVSGKGGSDTDQAGSLGNIVALCDVDSTFLEPKAKKYPKAKTYSDYRKMYDEMMKDIDAVTVSTPDHNHACASMMAIKNKKHVYCQKPLTHTVFEARSLREAARKYGVCTQMGNQGTAADGLRRAVELVQSGKIGPVKEAHVWTNRPVWPQAPGITKRPEGEQPIPKYLDWEAWIGPSPMRPFYHGPDEKKHRGVYHDFNWRGWWDFGTGALGDMACHTANMAFMALKLAYPTTIEASNAEVNPETYPAWANVVFQFPERGGMPAVKFVWYEGHKDKKQVLPSPDLVKGQGERDDRYSIYFKDNKWQFRDRMKKDEKKQVETIISGSFLIGEKGTLFSPDDYGAESYIVTPDTVERLTGKPEKMASNNRGDQGMKDEWGQAIRGGPKAYSNFDYAAMLTETILLGNVAMRAGGKLLQWNGPELKITNDAGANKFLHYEYRKGWTL